MKLDLRILAGLIMVVLLPGQVLADVVYAMQVVAFNAGVGGSAGFDNPQAVLGEPTRYTSPASPFGSSVTPFSSAFDSAEILSLGAGGFVTVKFPTRVYDQPAWHSYGADFIVFGNAFYGLNFSTLTATGAVFEDLGVIEVSQDGQQFVRIPAVFADTAFPTNGFLNPGALFTRPPADAIPSNFGIPVDPLFDPTGLTLDQIIAGYAGSGGGTAVDISSTGLEWIQYVRVLGAMNGVEVDAFAVVNSVPEPGALLVWCVAAAVLIGVALRRRRPLKQMAGACRCPDV